LILKPLVRRINQAHFAAVEIKSLNLESAADSKTLQIRHMGSVSLIVLTIAAIAFSAGGIFVSKVLVRRSTNAVKGQPYECGIPSEGSPWNQFNVGYYLFALLFLIFDVELIFVYPWAVVVKKIGLMALVEILIFFFILFTGFLYAHKKGALKWM
jgi:NADH-quinone oxidoreductase subunit A